MIQGFGGMTFNTLPDGTVTDFFGKPLFRQGAVTRPQQAPTVSGGAQMYKDPFGTAMSGGQQGTLQPYINRMTQMGSNALYGGLLNYQPQSMQAGDAGGQPIQSQVPQGFNMQSALQKYMGGQGLNFGNRSWMQGGGNG